MHKSILFGNEGRQKLLAGITHAANIVRETLGARGRTVIYQNYGQFPISTKDGYNLLRQVHLPDPIENVGAMIAYEASAKTVKDAGDGTTATAILLQSITAGGIKALIGGANPIALANGIQKTCDAAIEHIKKQSIPVEPNSEMLLHVATIAANNDKELGVLISDVFNQLGADAIITIGEPLGLKTETKINKGLRIPKGLANPHFINNRQKMCCELENPYVFIYENKIANMNDIAVTGRILDQIAKTGRPVLFMCEAVDEQTLSSMILSAQKNAIKICLTYLPSAGDDRKNLLEDIAAVAGVTICGIQRGIKITEAKLANCGTVAKVVVTREHTTFFSAPDATERIETRVNELREQLAVVEPDAPEMERGKLQHRIAKLTGGIAIIHVGGNSEMDINERKDRVDDAVRATQAALQEGVVTGGGIALLNAAWALELGLAGDEQIGYSIVLEALESPAKQIAENCGKSGDYVCEKIEEIQHVKTNISYGYNALNDAYEDLNKAGILDAAKVVRCSLENATTQALVVLSSEGLLVENEPKS